MVLKSIVVFALAYLATGAESATCTRDRCYLQVSSNRFAPATARSSGCTSFLRKTVTPAVVTVTFTAQGSNTILPNTAACPTTSAGPSKVPRYASACANRRAYSSACGCFRVSARTKTIAPCTTTIVVTPTPTPTSTPTRTTTTSSSTTPSTTTVSSTSTKTTSSSTSTSSSTTSPTSTTNPTSTKTTSSTTSSTTASSSTATSAPTTTSSTLPASTSTSTSSTSSSTSTISTPTTSSLSSSSTSLEPPATSTTATSPSSTSTSTITLISSSTVTPISTSTSSTATSSPTSNVPQLCGNQGLTWAYFNEPQTFSGASGYANYHPEDSDGANPSFVNVINDILTLDFGASDNLGTFYNQYIAPTKHFTVNHQGYIYAPTDGVYTFRALQSQGFLGLWLGASAYAGWDRSNDVLESYDLGGSPGSAEYQTQLAGGNYYPFRYVVAQSVGATELDLQVIAPDNTNLFAAGQSSPYLVQYSCDGQTALQFKAFGYNYQQKAERCAASNGCLDSFNNCISPGCYGNSGCVPLGRNGCNTPIGFS